MYAFDSYSAADQALLDAAVAGDLAGVKTALAKGGNPWKEERPVLWEAVIAGQTAVVAHLLAKVERLSKYQHLLSACIRSPKFDSAMFVLLLSKSEEADIQCALGIAIGHGQNHLVPTLLAQLPDNLPALPLITASESGNEPMVRLLLPRSMKTLRDSEAIRRAARYGHLGIVNLLAPHSPPHAIADAWEAACQGNQVAVVDRLLALVPVDRRQQGLQAAAEAGANDVVEQLIPLTQPALNTSYALRSAASNGRATTVALLWPHCPKTEDRVRAFRVAVNAEHDHVAEQIARALPVETDNYAGLKWAHRLERLQLFVDLVARVDPVAFEACLASALEDPASHDGDRASALGLLNAVGMLLPVEAVAPWVDKYGVDRLPVVAHRLLVEQRSEQLKRHPTVASSRPRPRS